MEHNIEKLSASTYSSLDQINKLAKKNINKTGDNNIFEKILNKMLVKELLTPILGSSIFGKDNNYGYFLQEGLTSYISENMHAINQTDTTREVK